MAELGLKEGSSLFWVDLGAAGRKEVLDPVVSIALLGSGERFWEVNLSLLLNTHPT